MANGSLALSAAYLAIGLGYDELITTPRTLCDCIQCRSAWCQTSLR